MNFSAIHLGGSFESDFDSESDSEQNQIKKRKQDLLKPVKKIKKLALPDKSQVSEDYCNEERKIQRLHYISLDAYARHKKMINDYILYYGGTSHDFQRDGSKDKRDIDVIREHHQFIWDENDNEDQSWEKNLAKRYYEKLFKEYCICDLSRYKENKVALRWRVEREVISGKGQFSCGSKKCDISDNLRSWEVNFAYKELGEKKNTLVKLRLCEICSSKLNYHNQRKEVTRPKKSKSKFKSKTSIITEVTSVDSSNTEPLKEGESKLSEENIWEKPVKINEEKSREEEFDEYFDDMLF